MKLIEREIDRIKALCKTYRVSRLFLFGSASREDFNSNSDVDFVVDFDEKDPLKYTDLYFQLKENLEQLLKRQIDLVEERGVRNSFFKKELDETKVLIYGQ